MMMMMMFDEVVKVRDEMRVVCFKILSQHLFASDQQNYKKPQSG